MRRFPQILVIWLGCTFAWTVLGSSLVARTGESSSALLEQVHLLWGRPLEQARPRAAWTSTTTRQVTVEREVAPGRRETVTETRADTVSHDVPLEGSDLAVKLDLTHRR